MLVPDVALARRFLELYGPPGRLLLCAITGSHQYGFPSRDSDLDIKGIHQAPTATLLGLASPAETHNLTRDFESVECDLTTNEIRQALLLLLGGNGNMLERILSPFQLIDDGPAAQLRELVPGVLSKRFHRHYSGFFRQMCHEYDRGAGRSAKTMLYAYRVALTGTHLLKTGDLVADLSQLAPAYGFPEALDLILVKVAGIERQPLDESLDALHRGNWPTLEALLSDANAHSPLPPEPSNRYDIEAWLESLRLEAVRAR